MFEEYYMCLFGGEFQNECDNCVIRRINTEIDLQKATKSSLSASDEKRKFLNKIESITSE